MIVCRYICMQFTCGMFLIETNHIDNTKRQDIFHLENVLPFGIYLSGTSFWIQLNMNYDGKRTIKRLFQRGKLFHYTSLRPINTPMIEAIMSPLVHPLESPKQCKPWMLVLKSASILTRLE